MCVCVLNARAGRTIIQEENLAILRLPLHKKRKEKKKEKNREKKEKEEREKALRKRLHEEEERKLSEEAGVDVRLV